jgi:SAM-dependent methyltransferase
LESNHYSAYRSPLHKLILSKILKDRHFEIALDVGCGVGTSSLALAPYAKRVISYDPSQAMIEKATPHQKVKYTNSKEELPNSCDLLCFFGSLEYIDEIALNKYTQILDKGGHLICCDFAVDYNPILKKMGKEPFPIDYNHSKNLSNYPEQSSFKKEICEVQFTSFNCNSEQLKSLQGAEFEYMGKPKDLLDTIQFDQETYELKATLYYSMYIKH